MSASDRPRGRGGRSSESYPLEARRLKDHEWPANDLAARERALRTCGPLSPPGPAVSWAPATKDKRWGEWGRYLAFLAANGELNPAENSAERLTEARLGRYIVALRARQRASSVRHEVVDLSYAIAALAPDRSWAWVRRHPELPSSVEVRMSRKPIVTPDPVQLLARLLDECARIDSLPAKAEHAAAYGRCLLVAIAICTGLRRRNLAEMRIGEHVRIEENRIRLVFRETVKNKAAINVLVPPFLTPYMHTYLTRHRTVLLSDAVDTGEMWITARGQPLAYVSLYAMVVQTCRRLAGCKVYPHLVRHMMATGIMAVDPRDLEVAAAALAHTRTSSVDEVYDRSGTKAAHRIWTRLLQRTHADLRKKHRETDSE